MAFTRSTISAFTFPSDWTQVSGIAYARDNRFYVVGRKSTEPMDRMFSYDWQGNRHETEDINLRKGTKGTIGFRRGETPRGGGQATYFYHYAWDETYNHLSFIVPILVSKVSWLTGESTVHAQYASRRGRLIQTVEPSHVYRGYHETNIGIYRGTYALEDNKNKNKIYLTARPYNTYDYVGGIEMFEDTTDTVDPLLFARTSGGYYVGASFTDKRRALAYVLRPNSFGAGVSYYRTARSDITFTVPNNYTDPDAQAMAGYGSYLFVQFTDRLETWLAVGATNIGHDVVDIYGDPELAYGKLQFATFPTAEWTGVRLHENFTVASVVAERFDAMFMTEYNRFEQSTTVIGRGETFIWLIPRESLLLDTSTYVWPITDKAEANFTVVPPVAWRVEHLYTALGYQTVLLKRVTF